MDVVAVVQQAGRSQQGLVTRAQLARAGVAGGTLHRALGRGELVRVRPGVYAAEPLPAWPRWTVTDAGVDAAFLAQVRAVLLSTGPGTAVGGLTGACLRGWGVLHEPQRTVELVVPHGRGRLRLPGVQVRQRRRPVTELLEVGAGDPLSTTTAVATVLDCCRRLPHLQAVVVVDSALRSGQVDLGDLQRAAAALRAQGRGRVRRVLRDADPECGSVLESVLRVLMLQAGITGFATQVVLTDHRGRRLLRADFVFAQARLVVETDGARWHGDAARDQLTDNRLAAAGWRVLRLSWGEVVHDARTALELVRAAVAAGAPRPLALAA